LVLEAIAAERMPHRIAVTGVEWAPYFELRDYGAARADVVAALSERGIRPVLRENGRLLFAFESLAAREKAWREAGADPEWIRVGRSVVLKELTVFRSADPLPDGHGSDGG